MDSNKRGFSLFGNYNLNETDTNVPGISPILFCRQLCVLFSLSRLVHSTAGMSALSPYLNFDPHVLNPVKKRKKRIETEIRRLFA